MCLGSSLGEGQPICKAAGDGGDLLMFNSHLFYQIKGECLTCVIFNLIILSILFYSFEVIN